eukprot:TRINITY_DN11786_c0_g1_i18.p1 TRINITY_DN11786_c0_g1~~TRINITY_DN11786_c0_g1_i18.p1  ORF type:complete len:128 (+),score=2.18 TRINITY_DN11786_c0_g1_i18:188-571(+)
MSKPQAYKINRNCECLSTSRRSSMRIIHPGLNDVYLDPDFILSLRAISAEANLSLKVTTLSRNLSLPAFLASIAANCVAASSVNSLMDSLSSARCESWSDGCKYKSKWDLVRFAGRDRSGCCFEVLV